MAARKGGTGADTPSGARDRQDQGREDQDRHEKARDLAEKALEEYAKGNPRQGDRLAEEAVRVDRSAVREVVEELDEDARARGEAGGKG